MSEEAKYTVDNLTPIEIAHISNMYLEQQRDTLKYENIQLKQKINKAIRFIKRNKSYISIETMEKGLLENDLNKLLQILDKVK